MADYEQKDNEAVIFWVDKVESENHPNLTGKAMIDGKLKRVSVWVNTSKGGQEYFKAKLDDFKEKTEEGGGYEKAKAQRDALAKQEVTDKDMEEEISLSDIPF